MYAHAQDCEQSKANRNYFPSHNMQCDHCKRTCFTLNITPYFLQAERRAFNLELIVLQEVKTNGNSVPLHSDSDFLIKSIKIISN